MSITQPVPALESIEALARSLQDLRQQTEALGVFVADRDLIECPACGLQEDVLMGGGLIACPKDGPSRVDSGLRFAELADDKWLCPSCGRTFAPSAKPDGVDRSSEDGL